MVVYMDMTDAATIVPPKSEKLTEAPEELRVSELLGDMRRPFAQWLSYEAYVAWVLAGSK
jgi:hypothetical protein